MTSKVQTLYFNYEWNSDDPGYEMAALSDVDLGPEGELDEKLGKAMWMVDMPLEVWHEMGSPKTVQMFISTDGIIELEDTEW